MAETRYWLLKCNVKYDNFDKLLAAENRTMAWMGVRNAQARNLMRDKIEVGDGLLFYHSSTAAPAVMGTARVVSAAYPDYSAWDKSGDFYDPKTDPANPKWLMVDIQADLEFARPVTLREIKAHPPPGLAGYDAGAARQSPVHSAGQQSGVGCDCRFGDGRLVHPGQEVKPSAHPELVEGWVNPFQPRGKAIRSS